MLTIRDLDLLRRQTAQWRDAGLTIALVPTMGNLHAGHLSLVNAARRHADRVVATVFVNPTQFGPDEDFDRYPRTLESDKERLADEGCHVLFTPSVETVYPGGADGTSLNAAARLIDSLCGEYRPGHFDGVVTVVARLLNMVGPDHAVFGEKDFQQLLVIQAMVSDLSWPVRIHGSPTVREPDGLAMSSRNQYLTAEERALAPRLHGVLLDTAAKARSAMGAIDALEEAARGKLVSEGFKPDYLAVRRADNLSLPTSSDQPMRVLAAAYLGGTRLIDNVPVH